MANQKRRQKDRNRARRKRTTNPRRAIRGLVRGLRWLLSYDRRRHLHWAER